MNQLPLFSFLVVAGAVSGATQDWTGLTSTNWNTGSNWSSGVSPVNDTTTDIARFDFASSPAFAPNVQSRSVAGIVIGDGTTAVPVFTLAGANLTLGALGVTKNVASLASTISTSTILAASQSWINSSATMLNVTGAITGGTNSLTISGSGDTTLAGDLTGAGSLVKSGNGTLYLTGVNGFTNGIYLQGGILEARGSGKNETLGPDSGALFFDGAGATLRLASNITTSPRDYVFTQTGTINTNGYSISLHGAQTGEGGFTKIGNGTITLHGTASYTGLTTVSAGTLSVGATGALTAGAAVQIDNVAGATFAITVDQTIGALTGGGATGGRVDLGGSTLTVGAGNVSSTFNGTLVGANGTQFLKTGTGTLTLTNTATNNAFTGNVGIAGGSIRISAAETLGKLGIANVIDFSNGGTLETTANMTFDSRHFHLGLADANGVAGTIDVATGTTTHVNDSVLDNTNGVSGALRKTGAGTLVLGGSNTYTGGTIIAAGRIIAGANGNRSTLGDSAGGLTFDGAGATLELSTTVTDSSRAYHLLQTGVIDTAGFSLTLNGSIDGAGGLTKSGNGTLTLANSSSTFSGNTRIVAGTLTIATTTALAYSTLDLATGDSGVIVLGVAGTNTYSIGALTGSRNLSLDANSLVISGTTSTTYSGTISGTGNLTKLGTGTLTLTGNSTYSGTTTATAGNLVINGVVTGDVLVDSDATLAGTGVLVGNVVVKGRHNPGNSPGVQVIDGSLTYNAGASVTWELGANSASNTPSINFDQIVVGSDLTFAGATALNLSFNPTNTTSTVDWTNSFWSMDQHWIIYDVTGNISGFDNLSITGSAFLDGYGNLLGNLRPDSFFSLSLVGPDLMLNYTSVPEPTTYGLALGVFGLAVARTARRRRQI